MNPDLQRIWVTQGATLGATLAGNAAASKQRGMMYQAQQDQNALLRDQNDLLEGLGDGMQFLAEGMVAVDDHILGLTRSVDEGFRESHETAVWSALLLNNSLTQACDHLARSSDYLKGIEQLLTRPLATQAAELQERGILAVRNNWVAEAIADLSEAIAKDPYQPVTHFWLGLALERDDRHADAAAAFHAAYRFCGDEEGLQSLAANAAILGSEAWARAGRQDLRQEVLVTAADRIRRCAELQLAAAAATNDSTYLGRALMIAPEVAAQVARSGGDLSGVAGNIARTERSRLAEQMAARSKAYDLGLLDGTGLVSTDVDALVNFADFDRYQVPGIESKLAQFKKEWEQQREISKQRPKQPVAPDEPPPPTSSSGRDARFSGLMGLLIAAASVAAVLAGRALWESDFPLAFLVSMALILIGFGGCLFGAFLLGVGLLGKISGDRQLAKVRKEQAAEHTAKEATFRRAEQQWRQQIARADQASQWMDQHREQAAQYVALTNTLRGTAQYANRVYLDVAGKSSPVAR